MFEIPEKKYLNCDSFHISKIKTVQYEDQNY